jgi:hypothetical protein
VGGRWFEGVRSFNQLRGGQVTLVCKAAGRSGLKLIFFGVKERRATLDELSLYVGGHAAGGLCGRVLLASLGIVFAQRHRKKLLILTNGLLLGL